MSLIESFSNINEKQIVHQMSLIIARDQENLV